MNPWRGWILAAVSSGVAEIITVAEPITFNKDVAPILFQHCAECHRPGQAAPFSLLSFGEAKKHAKQITEVTSTGYMPPWLPSAGYGEFVGERRLKSNAIETLKRWAAEGALEGDATPPQPPKWKDEWKLGKPDLVVEMPHPFTVPAEGKDIYRNFAIPVPLAANRFVKGFELRPGNARVLHHSFIYTDETRRSRRLSEKQGGFEGMEVPETAIMPAGQLLSWQPGKVPSFNSPGFSWLLKTNTDIVLQLHLHPSGKPDPIQPAVGLYFTDEPPTKAPFRLILRRMDFRIPAGESNVVVEQSYRLPVGIEVTRILPHAHYLGRDLQCYANLVDGTKKWLIWIKDWDFNWQGDYQYKAPVSLPAGSTVWMHYSYDNSTNNPRNPNLPPRDVYHGEQTTDEMASISLQVTANTLQDRQNLTRNYGQYYVGVSKDYYQFRVQRDPSDFIARTKLGRVLLNEGRFDEATVHLREAIRVQPNYDKAHYELGYAYLLHGHLAQAYESFQMVIRFNPDDFQAFGSLGLICLKTGRPEEARKYLQEALRLNPDDEISKRHWSLLNVPTSPEY